MPSGTIVFPFSPSDLQDTFLPSRRTMAIESQLFSLPLPLSVLLRSNQVYPLSTSITTAITTPWTSSSSRIPSPSGSQALTCFQFFHFFPPLNDSVRSKLAHTHIFLKKRLKDDWIPSFPIVSVYPTRLLYRVGTFKQPVFLKNLPSLSFYYPVRVLLFFLSFPSWTSALIALGLPPPRGLSAALLSSNSWSYTSQWSRICISCLLSQCQTCISNSLPENPICHSA